MLVVNACFCLLTTIVCCLQVDGGDPQRHLLLQPLAAGHQEGPVLTQLPPWAKIHHEEDSFC